MAADVRNPGAASPFLIIADHAGRCVPKRLGDLGLGPDDLRRHIAWDIGVAGLGARLAARLDATLVSQAFSRLVIDCNRDPARADSIVKVSDGTPIPGNRRLSKAEAERRRRQIFEPYHRRIEDILDRRLSDGLATLVVALHSFTPCLAGQGRPWAYGVLHMGDSAFSSGVLHALRSAVGAEQVGDNAPYQMDDTDYSVHRHARGRGLDYLELEVRQDLIQNAAGQARQARLLSRVLLDALEEAAPQALRRGHPGDGDGGPA